MREERALLVRDVARVSKSIKTAMPSAHAVFYFPRVFPSVCENIFEERCVVFSVLVFKTNAGSQK